MVLSRGFVEVVLVCILVAGCGGHVEDGASAGPVPRDSGGVANDAAGGVESVRFLPSDSPGHPHSAQLNLEREVSLAIPDSFKGYTRFRLSTDGSIFLVDGIIHRIFEFDREGRFVRRIGDVPPREEPIAYLADFFLDPNENVFYVADTKGIRIFERSGEYRGPAEVDGLSEAYGLLWLGKGSFLACVSILDGPFWALIRQGRVAKTFVERRRKLLPPDQEWRAGAIPPFLMTKDSNGSLYALSRTDYEVRKFDRDGMYLGDFRPQPDENLKPPPDGVDAETRRRWAVTGRPEFNWLMPRGLAVAGDYLVVQFAEGSSQELRNHYFSLDGHPAFEQTTTREMLLGADAKGLLYFGIWGRPFLVRVYSLTGE